ncbi:MBL fold metallo-hydrolase [Fusobacterium necrophorum]|uniref:MBL fold metallo-hydrolase n=1 Tax=Fusobacterium necrophorum TaxID=859 RepID=A0A4Q2KX25_9FUSO|nr:MBL fold metallo-hydrolase [Fusobacterium necrophorum]RXZ70185.1 MBL fold metallo-hydrolase [Fusobacterium necrophorum]
MKKYESNEDEKKMIRTFVGVGQGNFYVEKFSEKNITVIYDCGSLNKEELIKKIDKTLSQDKTIDLLFVSHFHQDHINGIPYLLENYNIKTIVLPFLTPENKKIMEMTYLIELESKGPIEKNTIMNDEVYCFINNPDKFILEKNKKKNQNIKERERKYTISIYYVLDDISKKQNENYIVGGTDFSNILKLNRIDWHYIPFNFRDEDLIIDLQKRILGVFEDFYSCDLIELALEERKKEVWKAIGKIYKDTIKRTEVNTNSMVIFSGPTQQGWIGEWGGGIEILLLREVLHEMVCKLGDLKVGCLYTGDYNANKNEGFKKLEKFFGKYWNEIGYFQIPHHGSDHNFSKDFLRGDIFYIISCLQEKNPYGHPGKNLQNGLSNKLFFIADDKDFIVRIKKL